LLDGDHGQCGVQMIEDNTSPFEKHHWKIICGKVSEICLNIFPFIKDKKVKSALLSDLFESQSEIYFNSIGIKTTSCKNDREPDLFFNELGIPCEIKVNGVDSNQVKKCTWLGGQYSKRSSDFIFINWYYRNSSNTLFGVEQKYISFCLTSCYVKKEFWKASTSTEYNGVFFTSDVLCSQEHKSLIGSCTSEGLILEKFYE
jgi:hypothetical protein